ncbi:synovial sarcoma, X breakpoint 2 interacting protein a [Stigmatopora argus]
MGEWWTTMPTDSAMGYDDICTSLSAISPSRNNTLASVQPSFRNSCNLARIFCTDDNVPGCISYINQELSFLGLSPYMETSSAGIAGLNAVPALNGAFEILQIHRRTMTAFEELEREHLKKSSSLDNLQSSNSRLRDQLELSIREKLGLHETERQLQLKIKTLQSCLKTEKEEVQKLQSMVASRASQYSHDAKRKERESGKLKERLSQLLVDRKEKRLAIEMLNSLGRADGKRSHWKTTKVTTSHEGQMYKSMLRDYEASRLSLMEENAELKKVLQQMKKEMIHILSPCQAPRRGADISQEMLDSDGEKTADSSGEILDLSCDQAREQLTNSIRQQWRKLRSHVEKMDHQIHNRADSDREVILRETHEDEMEKMRREVQQCKEFIHAQQQLLQQQLDESLDHETAELLNGGYTLEEKERLKEEWRLFEEQKRNFARERKYFTEAAIRLGREKKVFEEDRASWLKSQFLNMTPFTDRSRCSSTDGFGALSIRSEPERRTPSSKRQTSKSSNCTPFSTPKAAWTPRDAAPPSTAELYRTLRLIPDCSPAGFLNRGQRRERASIAGDVRDAQVVDKNPVHMEDLSIFSLGDVDNVLT